MAQHGSIRSSRGLHKLRLFRNFSGSPAQFWTVFLDGLTDLVDADSGLIVENASGRNGQDDLKILAVCSPGGNAASPGLLQKVASETLAKCSGEKVSVLTTEKFTILAVPLLKETGIPPVHAFLKVAAVNPEEISVASMSLMSVADIPLFYRREREAQRVLQQHEQIVNVLDLNVLLNSQTRFLSAAMVLCNELASTYQCARVSLGWRKGSYIRLVAMSQTDHFERKMEIVQRVEAAMEEAAEQNTEIRIPVNDNDGTVYVRDHEMYLKTASVETLLSVPARHGSDVVGVCLLEKKSGTFSDADMHHLRMLIDQATARLHDLHLRDRWAGARLADWARRKLALVLGFEHTWVKVIAGVAGVAVLLLVTIPVRYRVDSPMILKTDDITFLAAPFDGYIASVAAKVGENVTRGKVILALDKKELVLEEAGIKAEYTKSRREEDNFRAEKKLAEMRIAQSQGEQQRSRLDIVQLRLSQAEITAPFNGIIVEGDQLERIGSPVRQGEVLFKLGRIEDIRVEAKVSENEIQDIMVGAEGQIALASHPNELFPIIVSRIEPAAVSDATGNIFQVVCTFSYDIPQWLRPGMTGISKIEAGRKTVFWIIGHRTFDFLRLKLWW